MRLFSVTLVGGYSSADVQSMYCTAPPVDCAITYVSDNFKIAGTLSNLKPVDQTKKSLVYLSVSSSQKLIFKSGFFLDHRS